MKCLKLSLLLPVRKASNRYKISQSEERLQYSSKELYKARLNLSCLMVWKMKRGNLTTPKDHNRSIQTYRALRSKNLAVQGTSKGDSRHQLSSHLPLAQIMWCC
ncbi:hypothetical protein FGO68_gene4334 [Halteria grandinella]|uniref:Uncharacterized protein n=1 Tax=Halteria grandinella TaxID=5974 RepID=A0A8J8NDD7_HALGN|nr:hypothetical protein FGO68_gene4334 [Halteria grandinella]